MNATCRNVLAGFVIAMLSGIGIGRGEENASGSSSGSTSGISVVGVGTIKVKPTVVEIAAVVSGEGELANDAAVKYRDARKKAVDALNALNNPALSVESKGFAVNQAMDPNAQMRAMQGAGTDNTKQKVAVTEQLRLVLKDVDKLELEKLMETILKLIDTGRDNGLQVGPGSMNYYQVQMAMQSGTAMSLMSFKVPDTSAAREEAYKKALDDARLNAERIAKLSGLKLGRIVSVEDQNAGQPKSGTDNYYAYMLAVSQQGKEQDGALSSNVFGEIPLSVRLNVQFEIAK